jgi:Bacterial EndoU nuclease
MRLERLPAAHPSSPRYRGGELTKPVNLKALEFTDDQIARLDAQRADRTPGSRDDRSGTRPSGWDDPQVTSHPDCPAADEITLPQDRRVHILYGDGPGKPGGGHRHGTGRPGKTEFPAEWDDNKIVSTVEDVAREPDRVGWQSFNSRWRVTGQREGVEITGVVRPDGRIWTAWPEPGGRGVGQNPKA